MNHLRIPACIASLSLALALLGQSLPRGVQDTQPDGERPPTPLESLAAITVPEGFGVSLFAGEPDVRQPIAMTFDDRGRLWVVECYSYPEWSTGSGRDRVLIFEDRDHDGRFDQRTVFLEDGQNLTGIAYGFGGIWLCSAPNLLFVPDANGDDRPDGPPQIVLDGWATRDVKHNIFNGLTWGPDGWLYGCHGILAESRPAAPGTPDGDRPRINCGIWRFHPVQKKFEAVAHGTTNPWGLDFDDYGRGFFANCVIAHLWHLIPGARYERMYGQDYSPYSYELIKTCADHLHWAGEHWTDSRGGQGVQDGLGGGHAHCGTLVYLGDNWPDEYRNNVLMCNIHGARINRDLPVRSGSGFAMTHGSDPFRANSPWFRGVSLQYGPDGGVYVSDWNDLGECHDDDGVVRSSGRIYKVVYGRPRRVEAFDVSKLSGVELAELHLHANDYFVRTARRVLQHRASQRQDLSQAIAGLRRILASDRDVTRRLRALWTLHTINALESGLSRQLLSDENEYVRGWAVRLATESHEIGSEVADELVRMATAEASAHVRLELASALQRLPLNQRARLAQPLLQNTADAHDPNIPLMIWFGVEPIVAGDLDYGATIVADCRLSPVDVFAARRMVEADPVQALEKLLPVLSSAHEPVKTIAVIKGLLEGLRGRTVAMPATWTGLRDEILNRDDGEVVRMARLLGMALGDVQIAHELREAASDASLAASHRVEALRAMVEAGLADLPEWLRGKMSDPVLGREAVSGLASYEQAEIPRWILGAYPSFSPESKRAAINTLASRQSYAFELIAAIRDGRIHRAEVSAEAARQVANFKNAGLKQGIEQVWGKVDNTDQDKKDMIARLKLRLTPQFLAGADRARGHEIFRRTCASCHKVFGEGGTLGPDLTGSDRANLDYILQNTVAPNAVVGKDHQLTTLQLKDGRLLAGLITVENAEVITLTSADSQSFINKSDVAERIALPISIMPEGLLSALTDEEVRDLVAYLAGQGSPQNSGP